MQSVPTLKSKAAEFRNLIIVITLHFIHQFVLATRQRKDLFGLRIELPSVYHTRWRLHADPLIAERQAKKLRISIFTVFDSTRAGIKPKSTVLVADAPSSQPLNGLNVHPEQLMSRKSDSGPFLGPFLEFST